MMEILAPGEAPRPVRTELCPRAVNDPVGHDPAGCHFCAAKERAREIERDVRAGRGGPGDDVLPPALESQKQARHESEVALATRILAGFKEPPAPAPPPPSLAERAKEKAPRYLAPIGLPLIGAFVWPLVGSAVAWSPLQRFGALLAVGFVGMILGEVAARPPRGGRGNEELDFATAALIGVAVGWLGTRGAAVESLFSPVLGAFGGLGATAAAWVRMMMAESDRRDPESGCGTWLLGLVLAGLGFWLVGTSHFDSDAPLSTGVMSLTGAFTGYAVARFVVWVVMVLAGRSVWNP